MIVIALASLSLAGPPDLAPPDAPRVEPEEERSGGPLTSVDAPSGVLVALRGVGEFWHDTAIASQYRSGGIVPAVGLVVPITERIAIDADVGYHRMSATGGGQGVFQLVPMSLLAEARFLPKEGGDLELFAGAGPAMVIWSESGQDPTQTAAEGEAFGPSVLRGARPGLEVRMGARIDLRLVEKSMMPGQQDALQGVGVEILGSRRFATSSTGFNFNTWRVGVGLTLKF